MAKIKHWTADILISKGYTKSLIYLNDLVDIWNIIGDNYRFENGYLILPKEILGKVNTFIYTTGLDKKLTKDWDKYKNNLMYRGAISEEKYQALLAKEKKEQELYQIRQQEKERKEKEIYAEDIKTLNMLKEAHSDKWINSQWIEAMIGTFKNPFAEYYWTLIGKNGYKIKDWKGNLLIREDIYKKIKNDTTFKSYPGKYFLSGSFKNHKGYSAYIEGTFPLIVSDDSGHGIYGIYYPTPDGADWELVYIGMTQKGFQSRWEEHMKVFRGEEKIPSGMVLYQKGLDPNKISFCKLINIKDLKYEGSIGLQELKAMELAAITLLEPKYNIVGIHKPYVL